MKPVPYATYETANFKRKSLLRDYQRSFSLYFHMTYPNIYSYYMEKKKAVNSRETKRYGKQLEGHECCCLENIHLLSEFITFKKYGGWCHWLAV